MSEPQPGSRGTSTPLIALVASDAETSAEKFCDEIAAMRVLSRYHMDLPIEFIPDAIHDRYAQGARATPDVLDRLCWIEFEDGSQAKRVYGSRWEVVR